MERGREREIERGELGYGEVVGVEIREGVFSSIYCWDLWGFGEGRFLLFS